MEVFALIFGLLIIIAVLIVKLFTTFIHEFGHAVPAVIFSGMPVRVYIGSYGSTTGCVHIKWGKYSVYIRKNFLTWLKGICYYHATDMSVRKKLVVLVMGPLSSLLLAAPACYIAVRYDINDMLRVLAFIFLISSLIDFFVNVVPSSRPIKTNNGITYNDGHQIASLLPLLFKSEKYLAAKSRLDALKEVRPDVYLRYFEEYYNNGFVESETLKTAVASAIALGKITQAAAYLDKLGKIVKPGNGEYKQRAIIETCLGNYDKALNHCRHMLSLGYDDEYIKVLNIEVLFLLEKREELRLLYEKRDEEESNRYFNLMLQGYIANLNGKTATAVQYFEEANKLKNDSESSFQITMCLAQMGFPSRGGLLLAAVGSKKEKYINDYLIIAQVALYRGHLTEALKAALSALEINHNNRFVLHLTTRILLHTGRYDDAGDYADKTIRLYPDFGTAYFNKALAQMLNGFLEKGWETNTKARALDAENPRGWCNTGVFHYLNDEKEKAKEQLLLALEKDNTVWPARQILRNIINE